MVNSCQRAIPLPDLRDNEELMSLSHDLSVESFGILGIKKGVCVEVLDSG